MTFSGPTLRSTFRLLKPWKKLYRILESLQAVLSFLFTNACAFSRTEKPRFSRWKARPETRFFSWSSLLLMFVLSWSFSQPKKSVKEGVSYDSGRRRREETTIRLRKDKRDTQVSQRRKLVRARLSFLPHLLLKCVFSRPWTNWTEMRDLENLRKFVSLLFLVPFCAS